METGRLHHIADRPPEPGDWSAVRAGGRSVFVTANALPLPPADALGHLTEIWTYRLRPGDVAHLLCEARPTRLSIQGTHCPQLDFLTKQDRLQALAIDWNNKLTELHELAPFTGIEVLLLQDLRHVHDVSPLARLTNLRSLNLSGGIDTKLEIDTLDPLAGLPQVEELMFASIRIGDGRLDALAALPSLRSIEIANNAATFEEFARLAARIPHVRCDQFDPYIQLEDPRPPPGTDPAAALDLIGDVRVMVTGKRGPFLRTQTDRARLLRYCEKFEAAKAAA